MFLYFLICFVSEIRKRIAKKRFFQRLFSLGERITINMDVFVYFSPNLGGRGGLGVFLPFLIEIRRGIVEYRFKAFSETFFLRPSYCSEGRGKRRKIVVTKNGKLKEYDTRQLFALISHVIPIFKYR